MRHVELEEQKKWLQQLKAHWLIASLSSPLDGRRWRNRPTRRSMPPTMSLARHLPTVARILMGLPFFVSGLNGFLNFLPQPYGLARKGHSLRRCADEDGLHDAADLRDAAD